MNLRRKVACSRHLAKAETREDWVPLASLLRASRGSLRAWNRLEGNTNYYQFILIVCVSAGIVDTKAKSWWSRRKISHSLPASAARSARLNHQTFQCFRAKNATKRQFNCLHFLALLPLSKVVFFLWLFPCLLFARSNSPFGSHGYSSRTRGILRCPKGK